MQAHATRVAHFAHPATNVGVLAIEPGMVIADFGSGSGHYTLEFARQLAGSGRVYAIDVQEDLLRRIKNEALTRGLQGIEIVHGDIARPHGTKLSDRSVDLVLLSNVLFQLEDPAAALMEAARVIRPVGKVAVIDWSASFDGLGPIQKHVIPRERAHQMAEDSGFEVVRQFDAGAHHYGLLLRPISRSRL